MAIADTATAETTRQPARAFYSPTVDFLLLGGVSLLLIPLLAWLVPDAAHPQALMIAVVLANFINQPHFAHSYQIFYRTFRQIVSDPASDRKLRARYLWAGVGAPVALALFFAAALIWGDKQVLGFAGNIMSFFVGWHYVKQGYGMLMVDAAVRRRFFTEAGKKVLLVNSFACWILAWLIGNEMLSSRDFWGLGYATFDVPDPLLWIGGAILVATSIAAGLVLIRHSLKHRDGMPVNGIVAYVVALYPWLFLIREPVLGVFIPAMHSLQYLAIVWRYQFNVENAKADGREPVGWLKVGAHIPTKAVARFGRFILGGVILGVIGFWVMPILLGAVVPYDHAALTDSAFFFICLVFINVHHYFIDNAMWRKENPHTLRHLFTHH
jgi:hypothetical protein